MLRSICVIQYVFIYFALLLLLIQCPLHDCDIVCYLKLNQISIVPFCLCPSLCIIDFNAFTLNENSPTLNYVPHFLLLISDWLFSPLFCWFFNLFWWVYVLPAFAEYDVHAQDTHTHTHTGTQIRFHSAVQHSCFMHFHFVPVVSSVILLCVVLIFFHFLLFVSRVAVCMFYISYFLFIFFFNILVYLWCVCVRVWIEFFSSGFRSNEFWNESCCRTWIQLLFLLYVVIVVVGIAVCVDVVVVILLLSSSFSANRIQNLVYFIDCIIGCVDLCLPLL